MSKTSPQVPYFKVKPSPIPSGWSNDPDVTGLLLQWGKSKYEVPFQSQHGMPNPVSVVVNEKYGLWLIDSGDGKYYFWEDVADSIFEIYERNLAKILSTISKNGGLAGKKFRRLGIVGCKGTTKL